MAVTSFSLVAYGQTAGPPQRDSASISSAPAVSPLRALFNQYCGACHSEKARAAGLDSARKLTLDNLDLAQVGQNANVWEKVVRKLGAGMMPPSGVLLTATNNRHYKLATYLMERGAGVNIANKGGWTPLYLATDNANIEGGDYPVPKPDLDHLAFIKTLLEHGANPNASQGQHLEPDDLHDAVVLRGGRNGLRAGGAVQRYPAHETSLDSWRRSKDPDRLR